MSTIIYTYLGIYINKSMIYLYVKTHNQTGLKYLGKTVKKDPHKYPGSGKYWRLHLAKHGMDYSTTILLETEDPAELKEMGIYYSRLWNIVSSNEWANLKEEAGEGGAMIHTAESKRKISEAHKGRVFSLETRQKLSAANKGRKDTRSPETKARVNASISAKTKGIKKWDPVTRPHPRTGKTGGTHSESTKENMRNAWSDKRRAEQAVRTAIRMAARLTVVCPHCNLKGVNASNMQRYHFDNCPVVKPKVERVRPVMPTAITYYLRSPTGESIVVPATNLGKFCSDNNLNPTRMADVGLGYRKHQKGWTVTSVDRDVGICP